MSEKKYVKLPNGDYKEDHRSTDLKAWDFFKAQFAMIAAVVAAVITFLSVYSNNMIAYGDKNYFQKSEGVQIAKTVDSMQETLKELNVTLTKLQITMARKGFNEKTDLS